MGTKSELKHKKI